MVFIHLQWWSFLDPYLSSSGSSVTFKFPPTDVLSSLVSPDFDEEISVSSMTEDNGYLLKTDQYIGTTIGLISSLYFTLNSLIIIICHQQSVNNLEN